MGIAVTAGDNVLEKIKELVDLAGRDRTNFYRTPVCQQVSDLVVSVFHGQAG